VATNFQLGVQVTIIGMALVFLTLIIVMFAIILLDRLFRPKAEAEEEAPSLSAQAAPERAPLAVPAADDSDEVAAIGLALAAALSSGHALSSGTAMASGAASGATRATPSPAMVFPWDKSRPTDASPNGEVVTVVNIDSGSAVWRSKGRLKATEGH
jgi:sodium pump decarboxylase gamma subunit